MRKIWMILPALALIACGGEEETTDESETTTDATEETVEVVEEVEEVAPEVVWQEDNSAEETILAYLDERGWEGEKHPSGMYIVVDEAGSDEKPDLLDEVTIYYTGLLLDGTQFDGTTDEPATFPLNALITGWQIGIPYFGKGGGGKLLIPPGLGYGAGGSGPIPPNATLMFEIELVDFQKSTQQNPFM